MNFKEWFIINEGKEEKELALELAGDADVLSSLSSVIPQNKKDTDVLLLLAAYYYSKTKNKQQIKTEMGDYIRYLRNNRMPLIEVDLISKEPPNPWKDYLSWTEAIHGHQGEDAAKKASAFRPSDIDFQNEVPFMTSPDGKIKVYRGHSPQQCIILGKGQTFCISQPGNIMWQRYRDKNVSTFYFVYDDTRDDRLSIVVVDVQGNGKVVLTDKVNRTGKTLDPYTNELTTNSDSYIRYLTEKGIDVSKMVNIPKSDEEVAEDIKLGNKNNKLDWFRSLSHDEKSKYIGRGHLLDDEQFDYLWNNNYNSLLTQYVKTGLQLSNYQIDKIATDRDLRDNYLHNRLINNEQNGNLTKKEFDLLKEDQKKKLLGSMKNAIMFGSVEDIKALVEKSKKIPSHLVQGVVGRGFNLDVVKYFVEKGAEIGDNAVVSAATNGHLDIVKYLVEKGAKIGNDAVENAAYNGHLDIVKYLVEKGGYIRDDIIDYVARSGHLDIVKYFLGDEVELNGEKIKLPENIKKKKIGGFAVASAASNGRLDVVKYLVEKGAVIQGDVVASATENGYLDIVRYFVEKNVHIGYKSVSLAARSGHLNIVKYLVEKGAEIGDAVFYAAGNVHLDVIKYLVEKGAEIGEAVRYAAYYGHLEIVKYLVEKGAEIGNYAVANAAYNGYLDIVKYLLGDEVELNGEKIKLPENIKKAEIGKDVVEGAASRGRLNIVKYLVEKGAKIGNAVVYATNNGYQHIANYLKSELEKRKI